jgi:hypothetical protein
MPTYVCQIDTLCRRLTILSITHRHLMRLCTKPHRPGHITIIRLRTECSCAIQLNEQKELGSPGRIPFEPTARRLTVAATVFATKYDCLLSCLVYTTLQAFRVFADYYELLLNLIHMGHKIGHNFFYRGSTAEAGKVDREPRVN